MLLKVQSCNIQKKKKTASSSKSASCSIHNNVTRSIHWKVPVFNSYVLITGHWNVHQHWKFWTTPEAVEILYKVQSVDTIMHTADESMIQQSSREWPKVHLDRALKVHKVVQVVPIPKCPSFDFQSYQVAWIQQWSEHQSHSHAYEKFLEPEKSKCWKHVAKVLTLEKKQSWNVHPCVPSLGLPFQSSILSPKCDASLLSHNLLAKSPKAWKDKSPLGDGQVTSLSAKGRCWQHATALSMASGTFWLNASYLSLALDLRLRLRSLVRFLVRCLSTMDCLYPRDLPQPARKKKMPATYRSLINSEAGVVAVTCTFHLDLTKREHWCFNIIRVLRYIVLGCLFANCILHLWYLGW